MGPGLAEPIADEGVPNSVFMTENLWGVGSTAPYLHDGRATTLAEAILEHGGEGAASRDQFKRLSLGDQQALVAFLNNLILFKEEDAGAPPEPTQPPPGTDTPNPTATPTNPPAEATATPTQPDAPTETPAATLPPSVPNLALNQPATADSQCNENEGPAKAADGSTSTKWCSRGRAKWLQVDRGAEFSVTRFVIKHAGAGGERRSLNTRAFNIQVSTDGTHWNTAVRVRNNTASVTTHDISAAAARYVRLNITDAEQGRGGEARIYELEVYGTGGGAAPAISATETPAPAATATPTPAPTDAPPAETNLALNQPATSDSQCNESEGPAKAVNGSASGGAGDKWCSRGETKWLQVDLGADSTVARFVVKHAEAGGERPASNTRDFNIQVSTDGVNWTTVVTVTGNTAGTTIHTISATTARYVRLNVTTPQQNDRGAARIYELEVYGN
jgi:cell division septation protein DedD